MEEITSIPDRFTSTTTVIFPAQCSCGHIMQEKYMLPSPKENGEVGFSWCGWCRKKYFVKPLRNKEER